jgi:hypothetical protein
MVFILAKRNSRDRSSSLRETIEIVLEEFRERVKKIEAKIELLNIEVESIEEKIKGTLKNFEKELEKKSSSITLKETNDLTKQKKREIAKVMLKQGKSCEDVAKEVGLPLSEVKLIKEIISKEELLRGS